MRSISPARATNWLKRRTWAERFVLAATLLLTLAAPCVRPVWGWIDAEQAYVGSFSFPDDISKPDPWGRPLRSDLHYYMDADGFRQKTEWTYSVGANGVDESGWGDDLVVLDSCPWWQSGQQLYHHADEALLGVACGLVVLSLAGGRLRLPGGGAKAEAAWSVALAAPFAGGLAWLAWWLRIGGGGLFEELWLLPRPLVIAGSAWAVCFLLLFALRSTGVHSTPRVASTAARLRDS